MIIYVHTSGRPHANRQYTLQTLTPIAKGRIRLVVQASERAAYSSVAAGYGAALVVLPPHIKTLSPTRQWLLENAEQRKFVLMDDDLEFFAARPDAPGLFLKADGPSLNAMLSQINARLDKYAHVGIAAREGANRLPQGGVESTRMMRVLAYDQKRVLAAKARFDRVPTKQDFDMTLQLLRAGMPNFVLTDWCQNQRGGSDATGGCSVYRTPAMGEEVSQRLAELHPGLVKVVTKETKGAWGGGIRTDVHVQWKKALKG